MDENIILKYRREFDCWLCDECGIENANSQSSCTVCGMAKPPYPTILKAWSPEDEVRVNTPPTTPHTTHPTPPYKKGYSEGSGPIFTDDSRDIYEPPAPQSNIPAVLIWLIVFIVIFAALILYGMYSM